MALDTRIRFELNATETTATDLARPSSILAVSRVLALADGVGAGQADRIFHDTRTLAASGNEDLDLAGVLTSVFGVTITFARLKAIIIAAAPENTNSVVLGGAGTNAFTGPFGAATHTLAARPGGLVVAACTDATGWPVIAGTGDLLRVANSGAGTSVTYDVVLVGASA